MDFLSKYASFCCNVEYVESCFMHCQKTLLSAEMLNILNMLNVFWPITPPFADHGVAWAKKHSTYSTYSTFQQKEAFIRNLTSNMIQHIQHFSRKNHIKKKLVSGEKFNMPQKLVLSAEKIQHGPKSGYFSRKNSTWPKKWFFQQKNSTCAENVLLSAEMLNMLNVLGVWLDISDRLEDPYGPENIQHIQHIQHFSRKKRFFGGLHPTWFNIFNISAERSPWLLQNARNARFARFFAIFPQKSHETPIFRVFLYTITQK